MAIDLNDPRFRPTWWDRLRARVSSLRVWFMSEQRAKAENARLREELAKTEAEIEEKEMEKEKEKEGR